MSVHEHVHVIRLDHETREFLTHLFRPLLRGQDRLEQHMTEISDFLDGQASKADGIVTVLGDVAADVQALLAKSTEAGVFTDDEQAKADALSAKFDAISTAVSGLDTEIGDQDGSDTPAPGEGDAPVEG